ncbi:uncharacterized protein EI97DRAFT_91297 [Westerdykella ornata]|uniref:Uncharacterized protein n=1 Tax=Westerdykella ornata TaxID=318751 RepID=A0A6A6JFV0_WESOR|nr:uncharacterized protein EI97DRAFT_91297 [Westerdykella ornata]KAF2274868.1 hypothetical protein EI97DRAFT_91297 [Westerdykella ornata]
MHEIITSAPRLGRHEHLQGRTASSKYSLLNFLLHARETADWPCPYRTLSNAPPDINLRFPFVDCPPVNTENPVQCCQAARLAACSCICAASSVTHITPSIQQLPTLQRLHLSTSSRQVGLRRRATPNTSQRTSRCWKVLGEATSTTALGGRCHRRSTCSPISMVLLASLGLSPQRLLF